MDNEINIENQKKEKELLKKVENYRDPEGLTTKKLNFGLWFVERRQFFLKLFYGFLIGVSVVSWIYAIYGFTYYLGWGMKEDEILSRELVKVSNIGHKYIEQISAQPLSYYPVQVLSSIDKKYDLATQIENRNQKWWAEFNYYYLIGGEKTKKTKSFILPNQAKYLVALAINFSSISSNAQLIIEDLKWTRIDQHKINNWQEYYQNHLNIVNTELKFTPANLSGLSDKIGLNQFSFITTNKTAYNYWQVDYLILLYSGSNLININKYSLNDFMSGESRNIEISWPGSINYVDRVEVISEINIMRDDLYIKFESNGQEK